jgi:hypothetical protein
MRRFISSALLLLASTGWASAALGPLEAAVILIEAKATNAKCAFLSPAEAEKLNGFVARAEVSAVSAVSAEQATPHLHRAEANGRSSACNAESQARVREIYSAANAAMEAVNQETAAPQGPVSILPQPRPATPQQPARLPVQQQAQAPQPLVPPQYVYAEPQYVAPQPQYAEPQPQYVYAEPQYAEPQYVEPQYVAPQPQHVAPQPRPQPILNERFLARFSVVLERPEPQPAVYQAPAAAVYAPDPVYAPVSEVMPAGLDHYAHRATAYYVEIRCQHLNQQQAQQFWQSIATEHAALLERESPSAVESALAMASTQADQMACTSQTAAFVQQAFQGW